MIYVPTRMSWTQTVIASLLKLSSHPTILDQCFKEVFNYKKANFEKLYRTLSYVPWHVAMLDDDQTTLIASNWEDLFLAAVNDFVPKKKISGKQVPLWTDAEVKAL